MSHYLDPVNQAFADFGAESGLPPIYKLGVEGGRDVFEKAQAHEPASDVVSTSFDVPTKASPSGSAKTWIRKPKDAGGIFLLFSYFLCMEAGGSWGGV